MTCNEERRCIKCGNHMIEREQEGQRRKQRGRGKQCMHYLRISCKRMAEQRLKAIERKEMIIKTTKDRKLGEP